MNYPPGDSLPSSIFPVGEDSIEEGIIIPRKVETSGIGGKIIFIERQGIAPAEETLLQGIHYRIDINLLLSGLPKGFLHGSETEIEGAYINTSGRIQDPAGGKK